MSLAMIDHLLQTYGYLAAGAAVIGDNLGYWIGRRGGARLVERYGRRVGLTPRRLKVGRYLFDSHGGKVVFYGRFVSGLRTYAAFLAGMVATRRPCNSPSARSS